MFSHLPTATSGINDSPSGIKASVSGHRNSKGVALPRGVTL
jgi:hypothetical protein